MLPALARLLMWINENRLVGDTLAGRSSSQGGWHDHQVGNGLSPKSPFSHWIGCCVRPRDRSCGTDSVRCWGSDSWYAAASGAAWRATSAAWRPSDWAHRTTWGAADRYGCGRGSCWYNHRRSEV